MGTWIGIRISQKACLGLALAFAGLATRSNARGDVNYALDDGRAETGVRIDPGEDLIWMNTFSVVPGGEFIDSISLSFGAPGGTSSLNGMAASVLLYQDANGGLPTDAFLVRRVDLTITNANTTTITQVPFPATAVSGGLVVAVLFHNGTTLPKDVAPLDRTAPSISDRSYYGYGAGIDLTNLGAIPTDQFGTIESAGLVGNFVVRAHGVPTPGSGASLLALGLVGGRVRRRGC